LRLPESNNQENLNALGIYEMGNCLIIPAPQDINPNSALIIQQTILSEVERKSIKKILYDVSVISVLDSKTYGILWGTAQMAAMMGARTVFISFQPGVASALVDLDSDIDSIQTASTLEEGLEIIKMGSVNE